jgi:hypothetical protein
MRAIHAACVKTIIKNRPVDGQTCVFAGEEQCGTGIAKFTLMLLTAARDF